MAIALKNLRIGNYVFDDENEIVKISYLASDKYQKFNECWLSDEGYYVEQLEVENTNIYTSLVINPIPLVTKILVKFGFYQWLKDGSDEAFDLNIGLYSITLQYMKHDEYWLLRIQDNEYQRLIVKIEYVHELQNYVHLISNTELTFD